MSAGAPIAKAIDAMGLGRAQLITALLSYGVFYCNEIELILVTVLSKAMEDSLNFTDVQVATIVSIVFMGIAAGNTLGGFVSDRCGRRPAILISYAGVAVTSLLVAFTWNVASLLAVRFLLGLSMGFGQSPSVTLMSESAPARWRVGLMGFRGVLFTFGNLCGVAIVVIDNPSLRMLHWRTLIALGASAPAALFLLAAAFLRESPVYLAERGQHDRAKAILQWIKYKNSASHVEVDYDSMSTGGNEAPALGAPSMSVCRSIGFIFSPELVFSTVFLAIGVFTNNIIEYGTSYSEPRVFLETGATVPAGFQLGIKLCIAIVIQVANTCISMFLHPKFAFLLAYGFFMPAGLLILPWTGSVASRSGFMAFLYYLSHYLPVYGLAMALLTVTQFALDTYPTGVRSIGTGLTMGFGRIGAMVAPYLFNCLPGSWRNFYYLLTVVSVFTALLSIFVNSDMGESTRSIQRKIDELQPLKF